MDREKINLMHQHQIEELLLKAHIERSEGCDLIDEYFSSESSLDFITTYAQELLKEHRDPKVQEVILRNLSECIVVKMQRDKRSLLGLVRRIFAKLGIQFGKSYEVIRAEQLIYRIKRENPMDFL